MQLNKLFTLIVFCFSLSFINAQKLDYVQGDVIIRLADDESIHTIVNKYSTYEGKSIDLNYRRLSYKPMNIWLLSVDFTEVSTVDLVDDMNRDRNILLAQRNKMGQPRLEPNDTLFINQWQYINIGDNGGVEDADIDIEDAWDITTGGVTANGDTIVVCVVDDGLFAHADMLPNLWTNRGEIPGDDIDNDNNGFVDDMHGWNFRDNTNEVLGADFSGVHGTPVAGIVGAKGNNEIGVAGVNWDVKLMIIRYEQGITEASVLESYSYAYTQRRLYNETNGAEGAFVVATNSSWGIDGGDPESAPIWCAFYDSLGVEGIISCGATANQDFNIDETGDLPTGCASDYLVSVTNLGRNDVKVNRAGYGRRTVDLGAHGANSFTVRGDDSYGGFGGTSGATPHVAGAIALLYSVPCPTISDLSKSNPGAAALMVKDIILNQVDSIPGLLDVTTTGGRLNLGKAAFVANNACTTCTDVVAIEEKQEIDKPLQFEVSWISQDEESVDLRYRATDSEDWIEVSAISNPYEVSDLDFCQEYEYQIKTNCSGGEGEYKYSRFVETRGCCEVGSLESQEVVGQSVTLMVNNLNPGDVNEIYYREVETNEWFTQQGDNQITIEDLMSCTLYEYRIVTTCNLTGLRDSIEELNVFYTECGSCTELDYCDFELDNSQEYIAAVSIDGDLNISGIDPNGFGQFLGTYVPVLLQGSETRVQLVPGFAGSTFDEYWAIYIDFNKDGIFDPISEIVMDPGFASRSAITDTIRIPESAEIGNTRMRVVMSFDEKQLPCGSASFEFGEVEDYCVIIEKTSNVIEQDQPSQEVKVFPNPASTHVLVEYDSPRSGYVQLQLVGTDGRVVQSEGFYSRIGDNSYRLDFNGAVHTGLYLLEINSGGESIVRKVFVD